MKKTFAYEVGRHGIEYLYNKDYTIPQIAYIYGVSEATVRTSCRGLYGADWRKALEVRRAAYIAAPQFGFNYDFNAISAA